MTDLRRIQLLDGSKNDMSSLRPLNIDNGAVFYSDVDVANSVTTGWIGTLEDLFAGGLTVGISNTTGDNPKILIIKLTRTTVFNVIGLGAETGSFSNVKLIGLSSGGVEFLLFDGSSDNTPRTTLTAQTIAAGITGLKIEFHTTNSITLTNLVIPKTVTTISRLEAVKKDGVVTSIGATNGGNLEVSVQEYGDTPAIDAFGRLRTSEPFTIFDSKQLHDKQPLFWDESLGGVATSTHNSVNADVEMVVTANAADFVIRQTKQRFNYQPAKSQLAFMTFYSPQVSGITCRVGMFDGIGANYLTPNNGIFFECDGALSWNIAKDGSVTETIAQANWNVDKLDGTGVSGITLDMSSTQILIIDYEWLGVGRVRVGFVIDGLIYYCHYFNHANSSFTNVYMSTPNLPLRYSIETDGTNGSQLDHICSSIISEGGVEKTGVLRSVETGNTLLGTFTTPNLYAAIGIKLKTDYKDISIIPEAISCIIGTSDYFKWTLELNPTVAGTFTYNDLANSSIQYAVGDATNTITGRGLIVAAGGGSQQTRQSEADLKTALRIGSTIAGVQDELVLVFTPLSTNITRWASFSFRELL